MNTRFFLVFLTALLVYCLFTGYPLSAQTVEGWHGVNNVFINEETVDFDAVSITVNGMIYLPIRYMAEHYKINVLVFWVPWEKAVYLNGVKVKVIYHRGKAYITPHEFAKGIFGDLGTDSDPRAVTILSVDYSIKQRDLPTTKSK